MSIDANRIVCSACDYNRFKLSPICVALLQCVWPVILVPNQEGLLLEEHWNER